MSPVCPPNGICLSAITYHIHASQFHMGESKYSLISKFGHQEKKTSGYRSDLRDWVYTLETDIETLSSLVSSTRLRPRLKILESRDQDFDKTFYLAFLRPRLRPRWNFSYFRDRDLDEGDISTHYGKLKFIPWLGR